MMGDITINHPKHGNHPVPESANYFHFTHMQGEVQMTMGFIDLLRVHELRTEIGDEDRSLEMDAEITHRILLSPRAFLHLRERVNSLWDKIMPEFMDDDGEVAPSDHEEDEGEE